MSRSPYAPPASSYVQQPKPGNMALASKGQRFANFFVDGIICQIISFGVGLVIAVLFLSSGQPEATLEGMAYTLLSYFVGISILIGYYFIFEAATGKSPAKFITGTLVVSENGGKPSAGQILGRSAARLIPFEPFSVLFNSDGIGWHDSLSGTRVVKQ